MRIRPLMGLIALVVGSAAFAQAEPRAPTDAPPPSSAPNVPVSEPVPPAVVPEPVPPTTVSSPAPVAATPPSPVVEPTGPASPGDIARGEAKAAACGACHGMDGNSSDKQYPKLAGQHELYLARQLGLYKNGERENPVMLGFAATLSAQDMRDVGSYFASREAIPGVASDGRIVADAEETWKQRGERLYRGGNALDGTPACMACHGPSGRGNPGAKYPAVAGQHTDYTKAQLLKFRDDKLAWGKDENANTIMAAVTANLSDEDIEALASYIEGLHGAGAPAAQAAAAAPVAPAATAAPTAPAAATAAPAAAAPPPGSP